MEKSALMLDENDNVAVVLSPVRKAEMVLPRLDGKEQGEIMAKEDIPLYHKLALKDIAKGSSIYKYGEVIGTATQNISSGCHVHIHNVEGAEINVH